MPDFTQQDHYEHIHVSFPFGWDGLGWVDEAAFFEDTGMLYPTWNDMQTIRRGLENMTLSVSAFNVSREMLRLLWGGPLPFELRKMHSDYRRKTRRRSKRR